MIAVEQSLRFFSLAGTSAFATNERLDLQFAIDELPLPQEIARCTRQNHRKHTLSLVLA
jgi:hypothetical protein